MHEEDWVMRQEHRAGHPQTQGRKPVECWDCRFLADINVDAMHFKPDHRDPPCGFIGVSHHSPLESTANPDEVHGCFVCIQATKNSREGPCYLDKVGCYRTWWKGDLLFYTQDRVRYLRQARLLRAAAELLHALITDQTLGLCRRDTFALK